MVLIQYKKTDYNQFFYEAPASTPIESLIGQLVEVNNLRIYIDRLTVALEDLVAHGPLRPEETRGLSDDLIADEEGKIGNDKKPAAPVKLLPGQRFNPDKSNYRTGVAINEELAKMVHSELMKAKMIISKENIEKKVCLESAKLKEVVSCLRGAVMIAYPAYHGLPEWDPVRLILEDKFDFPANGADVYEYLDPKDTALWWAGKELFKGKLLSDYVGKNEKTKILVKLQKTGAGAPVREPAVDEKSYKNMLSHYYKKQEESKKLDEDNDDAYMNSAWANPKSLKNQLIGSGKDISWKLR
jgi:polyhydroxyalkanoate synthesis regulator phasin